MTQTDRSILHVDMDAFYASVEQRDNPELRGLPVVVGGGTNRGVVAAASYEARRFGIRSAMPMGEAFRRCADLCRVQPRMSRYKAVSDAVFGIFREFTPIVEGLSLDEAFLDVSASVRLFGSPREIAQSIKGRILAETGLTASVGVAANKLVAKIASDLDKPDGLTVIGPDECRTKLDPLPVAVIPGIGPGTQKRLEAISVRTIGELRNASRSVLEPIFGRYTRKTLDRAAGRDDRPVLPSRAEKSISAEQTFDTDLTRRADMERELLRLTERTASRMRRHHLAAGTIQVKIRQSDFTTCSRQLSINPPASSTAQVFAVARKLLSEWLGHHPDARIRLLGVGGSRLAPERQPDLFGEVSDHAPSGVDRTVDQIRDRFGAQSLERARTLDRH